ncbi:hypothetical protein [Chitinophaga vietnamensis]|uniref:hypothetical protein n=1 Tax=Chitinophaga vietnamensis TaxID=2593957 RepID=UPI001178A809|nr:hypothetical protein [Chitinophaga vietnamensis]
MKRTGILLLVLLPLLTAAQTRFNVRFSEPLAVYQFVQSLSAHAPDNAFKDAYQRSAFNDPAHNGLLAVFDTLRTYYSYDYTNYPYGQRTQGSTEGLLKKHLINAATINDFKLQAVGIIPNIDLITLTDILNQFQPVYRSLIYLPNKTAFEKQLDTLRYLVKTVNIPAYFDAGVQFYHAAWDSSIPFEFAVYPLPDAGGFTASAFQNIAVSAMQTHLEDYNVLLSVMMHEIFHILYDEESPAFKIQLERWFNDRPTKSSRYAWLLLNEALATAMGNGYVYRQLNGQLDSTDWYNRTYINKMAKRIYPMVKDYIDRRQAIDKDFADAYIRIYDRDFDWLYDVDNVLAYRYLLTDDAQDFQALGRLFPYRSVYEFSDEISGSSVEKMSTTPITKLVAIYKDHQRKLSLVKSTFEELKDWAPDATTDFTRAILLKDKTWLIIFNNVKTNTADKLGVLKLKKDGY